MPPRLTLRLRRGGLGALLFPLLLGSCVRPIEVSSEPRAAFSVVVDNALAEPMIVRYTDGRGEALLGTVPAGGRQSFVIASPADPRITITARNAAGTRTAGPYTVTLVAGIPQPVQLR